MSWVSENKFLTGFGAVMLAGVGTLGWFTYSAMDKADTATADYSAATSQLQRLHGMKPGLQDSNLKQLNAQKKELGKKIDDFKGELKGRVLKTETVLKVAFQDNLKKAVADTAASAAAAHVELPKDFYLGFGRYQSQPPGDNATAALDWELRAIEAVMSVLIKTGSIELETFEREPLPEEGGAKAGKQRGGGDSGITRSAVKLKFTGKDDALRNVLTKLANHKQQLYVIRTVSVQNKVQEPPPRVAVAGAAPALAPDAAAPAPAPAPEALPPVAPIATGVPAAVPAPPAAQGAPAAHDGPLAYVFGAEKITVSIELEIVNFEEPKAGSEKPEKGGKKKDK